jgi:protein phosphatase
MNFTFHTQSDPGRTRENNEDSAAFDESACLAILADGMGGYNAGEIASGMATAFIKTEMGRWLSEVGRNTQMREIRRALEICVDNANQSIFSAANSNAHYSGMGTTLVVGVFHGSTLLLGHIGDSRCYRLRGQQFLQLTKDHSLLQEQVDSGLLTIQEAAMAPNRNLVTRALGVEDTVLLDVNEYPVQPGDLYLMCSDGLTDMVEDEEMANILEGLSSLEQKSERLVSVANEHGGRDNITVLLVQVDAAMEKRGLIARLLGK